MAIDDEDIIPDGAQIAASLWNDFDTGLPPEVASIREDLCHAFHSGVFALAVLLRNQTNRGMGEDEMRSLSDRILIEMAQYMDVSLRDTDHAPDPTSPA